MERLTFQGEKWLICWHGTKLAPGHVWKNGVQSNSFVKNFTSHQKVKRIADSTVRRLSTYLRYLEELETDGQTTASSDELATLCGTTPAQVRKDLSFFGSFGKRGLGYPIAALTERLKTILGLQHEWPVIIIGAGKVGAALAGYEGFLQRKFRIVGVYDNNPLKVGTTLAGVTVRDISSIQSDIGKNHALIAILAIPADSAQDVADITVRAGVRAILNFAPTQLHVPQDVAVKTVNMAMELEGLSFALTNAVTD